MAPDLRQSTQALSNPDQYGGLSASQQDSLRLSLSQAINLTVALAGSLDTSTASTIVSALNAVVSNASNIDVALFNLLLQLVQTLASLAGAAASSFLAVISAMIKARGVGSNANADAISSTLNQLALSILSDAVCGQPTQSVTSPGLDLKASFQSNYGGSSVNLAPRHHDRPPHRRRQLAVRRRLW